MDKDVLKVRIIKPESVVFEGEATDLSSVNSKGPFDILPDHTNFITVIQDSLTIFLKDGSAKVIPFDIGVLRLFGFTIDVYLGVKVAPEQAIPVNQVQNVNNNKTVADNTQQWLKEHHKS